MRFLHIFSAVVWLIAIVIMFINWSFDVPLSWQAKACIVYAIAYATFSMGVKALESLDELMIIWDQRMDRRPRI